MSKFNPLSVIVNGELVTIDKGITTYTHAEIVSYEGLLESGIDCADDSDSVEEIVSLSIMKEKLQQAMQSLTNDERTLINALYYSNGGEGTSERVYANSVGIPRTTIEYRKNVAIDKLKQILQK